MRQLSILIIFAIIYPFVCFALESHDVKLVHNINEIIYLDSLGLINNSPSQDSISLTPINQPTTKDTTNQFKVEQPVNINDTSNLLNNVPLVSPTDSSSLIQEEKKIPGDTLKKIQPLINDLPNNIIIIPKDSISRIEFRSVYADSVEQNNPNFLTRKVLEIKWISDKRDTVIRFKNIVGLNFFYGMYTYGFGGGIYKRLSNDADFIANINFNYIFDNRTPSDLDSNGNLAELEHESRIYSIIFNVGLEKYFLQNRNSWKIKPILIFGFAPAIVFSAPYSLKMFSSFKKMQLSYGIGIFAALGFDYQAFKTFGINLSGRYSFIPVIIGRDVYYYKGFKVKNVGGFYVNLGVSLLKPFFSKK
jgi:hypothetical protein